MAGGLGKIKIGGDSCELCGKGTAKFGRIRTVEKLFRTRGRSTPGTTVSIFNVAPAFSSSARATNPPLLRSFPLFKPSLHSLFFPSFAEPEFSPLPLQPSRVALAHVHSPVRLAIFFFFPSNSTPVPRNTTARPRFL